MAKGGDVLPEGAQWGTTAYNTHTVTGKWVHIHTSKNTNKKRTYLRYQINILQHAPSAYTTRSYAAGSLWLSVVCMVQGLHCVSVVALVHLPCHQHSTHCHESTKQATKLTLRDPHILCMYIDGERWWCASGRCPVRNHCLQYAYSDR